MSAAIKRQRIARSWAEWSALEWEQKQGYVETSDYSRESIQKVALRLLVFLLRRYRRLLKQWNANLQGSRKAKYEKVFVAERSTAV